MLDSVEKLNLTKDQSEFLKTISDATFRETTRDFLLNQQFRKDYWVKGPRKINPTAQSLAFKSIRLLLLAPADTISLKVGTVAGEASLNENVYKPVLAYLADHKVRTVAQIEEAVKSHNVTYQQLVQAVVVLTSLGHSGIAQDEAIANKRLKSTQALNTHLMELARSSNEITFLASPVTGGGHYVSRFHQMFLLARHQGHKAPQQWAAFTWGWLKEQGQRLVKHGQPLNTEEENLAQLTAQAQEFETKNLPILKALQIA